MSSSRQGVCRYLRGTFQQTCGFCGCVFRVEVPGETGRDGPENYHCPECRRRFPVRASDPPRVTLISKRTDGLKKQCPADWQVLEPRAVRTPPRRGSGRSLSWVRRERKAAG